MLTLGQIQYDAGQLEEARKSFAAAARIDPGNRLVQAHLGLSLLALGRIEEGSALLDAHLLFGYEGLEARLLTFAEHYLWQHREAARSLDEQLAPDEGGRDERPAGFGLQFASAVRRILLWPLARLRGKAGVSRLEAEEAFSTREWDKAIAALHRAEEAGADPEDTAAALGLAYLEAHKPEAAAGQLLRLPEEVRSEPDIALALGVALFDSERYEEAKRPLQIASERFSRDFLPPYLGGLCEIDAGQPKVATRWFSQSVERLNPQLARKRFEEMMRIRAGEGRD